jgi:hypothetical protein
VDTHLGHYKTLGESEYATLADALSKISNSTQVTLTITAVKVAVTSNTTIPANIHLGILKGGKFDVATGKTFTINAP